MAKVVTSQGIADFVQSGKHEVITDKPPVNEKEAPALEVVKGAPTTDIGDKTEKAEPPKVEEEGLEPDEVDFPEVVRRKMGKKHKAMMEAKEAAQEAERFAENQYNRARLAEQRAEELEERLKQAQPKEKEPEIKEPDESDPQWVENGQFNWRKFTKAQADFAATKAVAEERKRQSEELQKAQALAAEEAAKARVAETRKAHADYDEVIASADVKTHNAVLQYMTASDNIGEIAYYLAKNPEFVERINKLNPLKAIAEIGKLELTFEKPKADAEPPPPKLTKVPPPIQPIEAQGSGAVQTDPSKMSFRELRAYEAKREAAKRRH